MADWRSALSEANPGDFGIIGDPVEHSLSPVLQDPALDRWWRTAGRAGAAPRYRLFHVPAADVPAALVEIKRRRLAGINVTVPHKTGVVAKLDRLDAFARQVGAVNTIKLEGSALVGYNTDGRGFAMALSKNLGLKPRVAVVLGGGGTAQVIIHQLLALAVETIYWWNRTPGRIAPLIKKLPPADGYEVIPVKGAEELGAACADADLIVNATPVGLNEGDGLPADGLEFRRGKAAFDVIYNRETAFLKAARAAGAKVCGGLPMLLYQGAAAFEIWTGAAAPVDLMKDSLMKAVKEKGIQPVWPSVT